MKLLLFVCISFAALSGCSLLGTEGAELQLIDVPADSVAVLEAERGRAAFQFVGGLPVPCYEFAGAEVEREEHRIEVRVRARSTAEVCVTVTGILRVSPLEVAVAEPGRYTFAFWRGELPPVEVEVDVP